MHAFILSSVVSNSFDLMDYSPPGSSVHEILQARILEWVSMPSSRGSSRPRDQTCVSCIGRQIFLLLRHLGSPFNYTLSDLATEGLDFPGRTVDASPSASTGDMGSIPGPGRFHISRSKSMCQNY